MFNSELKEILSQKSRWIFGLTTACLIAFVAFVSPDIKFINLIYKTMMVSSACLLGYWVDRMLNASLRPRDLAKQIEKLESKGEEVPTGLYHLAGQASLRRAIIIAAAIIGVTMGL